MAYSRDVPFWSETLGLFWALRFQASDLDYELGTRTVFPLTSRWIVVMTESDDIMNRLHVNDVGMENVAVLNLANQNRTCCQQRAITLLSTQKGKKWRPVFPCDSSLGLLTNIASTAPAGGGYPSTHLESTLFPHSRHGYNDRRLRVLVKEWLSFLKCKPCTGDTAWHGLLMDVLEIASAALNFSYELVDASKEPWGTGTVADAELDSFYGKVIRQEVDLGLMCTDMILERTEVMDFTDIFMFSSAAMVYRPPPPEPFQGLLSVISSSLLLAVGGGLAAVTLTVVCLEIMGKRSQINAIRSRTDAAMVRRNAVSRQGHSVRSHGDVDRRQEYRGTGLEDAGRNQESAGRRQENADKRQEGAGRTQENAGRSHENAGGRQEGADRRQEGADRRQQGADRRQEGPDRRQEGADRRQEGAERRQEGADRRQQGADRRQECADRRQEGADRRPKNDGRIKEDAHRTVEGDCKSQEDNRVPKDTLCRCSTAGHVLQTVLAALLLRPSKGEMTSQPGRMMLWSWRMLSLVLAAAYSGTLTAFLSSSQQPLLFSRPQDLLTKTHTYTWGTSQGYSLALVLENSQNPLLQDIWSSIQQFAVTDPEVLTTNQTAVAGKVRQGNFVSIMDHTFALDLFRGDDDVVVVATDMQRVLFSLVLPKGSALTAPLSAVIRDLHSSGLLSKWKNKWFPRTTSSTASPGRVVISLLHVQGVLLVLPVGAGLALCAMTLEVIYVRLHKTSVRRPAQQCRHN